VAPLMRFSKGKWKNGEQLKPPARAGGEAALAAFGLAARALSVSGRMSGQPTQKRRCRRDCSARLLRQGPGRSQEAIALFTFTLANTAAASYCRRRAAITAPTLPAPPAPRIPARVLPIVGRSGTWVHPLRSSWCFSASQASSPPGRSRTSHLQHSAATLPSQAPHDPPSAVAHSAHAIASALRAPVALARPLVAVPRLAFGVRAAASCHGPWIACLAISRPSRPNLQRLAVTA
jgi:hypothetical protein